MWKQWHLTQPQSEMHNKVFRCAFNQTLVRNNSALYPATNEGGWNNCAILGSLHRMVHKTKNIQFQTFIFCYTFKQFTTHQTTDSMVDSRLAHPPQGLICGMFWNASIHIISCMMLLPHDWLITYCNSMDVCTSCPITSFKKLEVLRWSP